MTDIRDILIEETENAGLCERIRITFLVADRILACSPFHFRQISFAQYANRWEAVQQAISYKIGQTEEVIWPTLVVEELKPWRDFFPRELRDGHYYQLSQKGRAVARAFGRCGLRPVMVEFKTAETQVRFVRVVVALENTRLEDLTATEFSTLLQNGDRRLIAYLRFKNL